MRIAHFALTPVRFLRGGILLLTVVAALASGVQIPTAQAATCSVTGSYYVNPAAGVDRTTCWGYDKYHEFKTVQGAIDYVNALWSSSGGSPNATIYYLQNGGTETINNAAGVPFTIRPYSDYTNITTKFDVVGQNLTFTKFTFTSGRVYIHGTSNSVSVLSNQFNGAGYRSVEVTSKSTVQIQNNTFTDSAVYVHDNAARVTVWTNTFKGTAPNFTLSCGSSCTMNYGNWYTFVMKDSAGGFDFVGNRVSNGQALRMDTSTSAIVMSNTVAGTGAKSDKAFYFFDTDLADLNNNTISSVGIGAYVQGWSKTVSVNYAEKNTITLVGGVSTTGLYFDKAKINEIYDNTVSGGETALAVTGSTVKNIYNNTLNASSMDAMVYSSTVDSINNNTFNSKAVGLDVLKNSVVGEIRQNYFGSENSTSGIGLILENESNSFSNAQKSDQTSSTTLMDAKTKITQNTFDRLHLGIGLNYAKVQNIRSNNFITVDGGVESYDSVADSFQGNTMTADTAAASSEGTALHATTISSVQNNSFTDFVTGMSIEEGSTVSTEFSRNAFVRGDYGLHLVNGTINTPLTNLLFVSNDYGFVVDDLATANVSILYSTFYEQSTLPLWIGDVTAGPVTISSNLFSAKTALPAIRISAASDLGVLDYNLYSTPAMGSTLVNIGGMVMNLASAQAGGHELNGYEETITSVLTSYVPAGNSLAVNSGDMSYAVSRDFNNVGRPICSTSDRGALEAPGLVFFPPADADGDGLCSFQETAWGTSDSRADSDFDGLNDQEEIYVYRTGVTDADTDGDSYSDYEELMDFFTDPLDASSHGNDADRDEMDDTWELSYGLDPSDPLDVILDGDGDGLSNGEEYVYGTSPVDEDSDDDGLNDQDEIFAGTDPWSADTDADGMDDAWETTYGTDPLVVDSGVDDDADGISNYDEYLLGTHPRLMDTDSDGLQDGWEQTYGTDPVRDDAAEDPDADGLSNSEENANATYPLLADSDADGFDDGEELEAGTDPLDPSSFPIITDADGDGLNDSWEATYACMDVTVDDSTLDADSDGLTNSEEYTYNSNPCSSDSDSDGFDDAYEALYGLDLTRDDTALDLDSDGLSNGDEFAVGTNPAVSDSDGDGFADGLENTAGSDPLDASSYPADGDFDSMDDVWEDAYACMDSTVNDASFDADLDTLTALQEYSYGTNPCVDDTDGDGMDDAWELLYRLDATVASDLEDADADGLTDFEEFTLGSDPTDADTDGDGMGDAWEVSYGLALLVDDASLDLDGDGLSNFSEYNFGTDPSDVDTDADGMPDDWELSYVLDATVYSASTDTDADLLADLQEYLAGTDPTDVDSDGDVYTDGAEVLAGTDPLDATDHPSDYDGDGMDDTWESTYACTDYTTADDSADPDADALTNMEEYLAGTLPCTADTDGDVYTDGAEVLAGTDPLDATDHPSDYDGDGMDDTWESTYACTDYTTADDSADPDADALTNMEEYLAGTLPCTADSDGDVYTDGAEVLAGTDPLDATDHPSDADGDGLDAAAEATYGTDPSDADTDDDGLTDGDEVLTYLTDPTTNDTDGDLYTDAYEIDHGASALSASSTPSLTITVVGYDSIHGFGVSTWTYSTTYYWSTLYGFFNYGDSLWTEIKYNGYGAFGVKYDTTAYLGTVSVSVCGSDTSAFDAMAFGCATIPSYSSSSSPDTETTEVDSSSQLEAWTDLSSYYSFSDYRWFRPLVSTADEYVGFRIRVGY